MVKNTIQVQYELELLKDLQVYSYQHGQDNLGKKIQKKKIMQLRQKKLINL